MTMVIRRDSDRHERRRGRNLAVLIALIVLAALVFAVTTVKLGPNAANPSVGKTWGTSLIEWLQGDNIAPGEAGESAVVPGGEVPGERMAPDADAAAPNDTAADAVTPDAVIPGEAVPELAPESASRDVGPNDVSAPNNAASDLSPPVDAGTEGAAGAMMSDDATGSAGSNDGAGAAGELPGNGSDHERMPE